MRVVYPAALLCSLAVALALAGGAWRARAQGLECDEADVAECAVEDPELGEFDEFSDDEVAEDDELVVEPENELFDEGDDENFSDFGDEDGDGEPRTSDEDEDDDGVLDAKDCDRDSNGRADAREAKPAQHPKHRR